MKIAIDEDVPAYIIFSDATLQEMIQSKPKTLLEMKKIPGVGDHKFEKYAGDFLGELNTH